MTELESSRLILRPLEHGDATQRYVDWLNDPAVNRYLETRHQVQTLGACRSFIEQSNKDPNTHLFGIFLKETGEHIGNAKLGFINPLYKKAQLSLFIGEQSCWNHGFAGEVVRTLTDFGFNGLGMERIEAGCYEENLASLRVFLKAGYTVEGFMRSHVVSNGVRSGCFWLGILKNEWR